MSLWFFSLAIIGKYYSFPFFLIQFLNDICRMQSRSYVVFCVTHEQVEKGDNFNKE